MNPTFDVMPAATTVAQWDLFEALLNVTATYTNPYDYSEVSIRVTFTAPSGRQQTVDAFWMQDYTIDPDSRNLSPTGEAGFRVRITPDETGDWSYIVTVQVQGGPPAVSQPYTFSCSGVSATGKGYIRKTAGNHYLKYDSGAQYIPVGENIAFPDSNVIYDYDYLLNKLEPVGVNFIRVWEAQWGFGLEWSDNTGYVGFGGLKHYRQESAKSLDYLLARGHTNGYAVMLCFNYHNQLMLNSDPQHGQWDQNPYNTANGGPCSNPSEFFTNATAKAIFQNRLRYIVARWGYAGSIQSWELFNEVDQVYNYANIIAGIDQWHDDMAAYLKSIDPNHLVTTSFGLETHEDVIWQNATLDFTQTHKYKLDANLPRLLAAIDQHKMDTFGKPTITAEFGLSVYAGSDIDKDPNGTLLHNVMWTTLCNGAMGAAIPWWEHWIDPQNLYPHFSRLAAFKDVVPFEAGNYRKVQAEYDTTTPVDVSILPEGNWDCPACTNSFTLNNEGELVPGVERLSFFIYGMGANETRRNPATITIHFVQPGKFIAVTNDTQEQGSGSHISIYVDGVLALDAPAVPGQTYAVDVPQGTHAIKIDNLGVDWAFVPEYVVQGAAGPFNTHVLQSADLTRAAGYILQRQYNYAYLNAHHQNPPPPVPDGTVMRIPGMQDGTYTVQFYSCAPATTTAPAQPVETRTAVASSGTLTLTLPAIAWDVAFTATRNNTGPGPITSTVTVTPQAGWGSATQNAFTVGNTGITPDAATLGMFIYGSDANTQYRNPPTFMVDYAQAGYFEVRTGDTVSQGYPRVTVYVDGVMLLDQPAFVNTSYCVMVAQGQHSIQVDNLGGDWTLVEHFSFVPALSPAPPVPQVTSGARTVTPAYNWGSAPPYNSFSLGTDGTLTPDASNLGIYVYGSQAHPEYRNPATITVTFPQNGYIKLMVGPTVSAGGASRVSIYVDGELVTNQPAFPNLPYVVTVAAGTHNITLDNLGGDWITVDTLVFDVLYL